jgi:3'-phosphoadenosine 5'-phosphosulfate sulfotransferase (PAPS reductase)/FAD synthetase
MDSEILQFKGTEGTEGTEGTDVIEKALRAVSLVEAFLRKAAEDGGRPCVMTSFGKDSMVLLHVVGQACERTGVRMPDCVCFREPFDARKYRFAHRMAEFLGLRVYDWRPSATAMQQAGDEFEVQNYYRWGQHGAMTCPTGIVPPEEGQEFLCAVDDLLMKPLAPPIDGPWTHFLIGHKGSDADPIYGGDAGTRVEWRMVPGAGEFLFPLRDFTDDDIWDLSELEQIPQNGDRYQGREQNMDDLRANPDFFHACTRCLDRRPEAGRFVTCPKRGGATVENISSRVAWADQSKPSYMEDQD